MPWKILLIGAGLAKALSGVTCLAYRCHVGRATAVALDLAPQDSGLRLRVLRLCMKEGLAGSSFCTSSCAALHAEEEEWPLDAAALPGGACNCGTVAGLDSGEEERGWRELGLARVCGLPGLDKGEEERG